jgi:hypothetical protein
LQVSLTIGRKNYSGAGKELQEIEWGLRLLHEIRPYEVHAII